MDLGGKVALVTGGGSGICLAFAQKLLQNGCSVLIADLALLPEAESLLHQPGKNGARAVFVKTDVTDWKQLQNAFDETIREFTRLDIVCPGAGIFEPPPHRFWDLDLSPQSSSYKVLDINLSHPIRCTQHAIDSFLRQKVERGVVVHISSMAAQIEAPVVPIYAASKAGLSHFIRNTGFLEQAANIRVVGVAPANVKTPLWKDAKREEMLDESQGDVWIRPERIAEIMLDLTVKAEPVGGTIWEIGADSLRRVERINDPGPDASADGFRMANVNLAYAEITEGMKNFGGGV